MNDNNRGEIKTYRDLIAWQKSHELAKHVLQLAKNFPEYDESRIVKKQLVRATLSVPANIAEGYGGHRGTSYRNYLVIARRSATECDYWLYLSFDMGYIDKPSYSRALALAKEIIAILSAIINKLESKTLSDSALSLEKTPLDSRL